MSITLAKKWFEAFEKKDASLLKLSDDFVHSSPFGEIIGKEAYMDLVKGNEEAFFNNKIEIEDMIAEDKRVAVRYLVNGNPACDCIYVEGDKISRIFSYYHFGEKPSF